MNKDYLKRWFHAAAIRAIKTAAQVFIASMPTTAATLGSVDWTLCLSTAAVSAIASMVTSIAGLPEVEAPEDEYDN